MSINKCIYCGKDADYSFSVELDEDDNGVSGKILKHYSICKPHYFLAMKVISAYSNKYDMEYIIDNLQTILKIPQE